MRSKERVIMILLIVLIVFLCGFIVFSLKPFISINLEYNSNNSTNKVSASESSTTSKANKDVAPANKVVQNQIPVVPITHIATPKVVKAVYLTNWVAGSPKLATPIFNLVKKTELNSVVVDIKDSTGRIGFTIPGKEIAELGSIQKRVRDIKSLIYNLHKDGIYVIGRISTFQDPYLTKIRPGWALKKASDGAVWENSKSLAFLDPTNPSVENYILNIALGAYSIGFDEINFDYIRYPSDGDIKNIDYNLKPGETRADNIEKFFEFIHTNMKKNKDIPISVDLFGMTTEVNDDMGIGQVWGKAMPYFDYICPMLYPSHYSTGHLGFANPAEHPYEIISNSLSKAIKKSKAINQNVNKIRPWLQDFDLGAVYDKSMVNTEIKAVYDADLASWTLWSPENKYDNGVLKLENNN